RVRLRPPRARPRPNQYHDEERKDREARKGSERRVFFAVLASFAFSRASDVSSGTWFATIRAMSHSASETKKTSSTDFCTSPSKNIAGAYSAMMTPAAIPARREKSRRAASATNAHDADPIAAWMIRTSSRG